MLIEEYQQLMKKATHNAARSVPSLAGAEEAFEVSVVTDEAQHTIYHRGLASAQYMDADVVDVEVVNHSPFLAGY